MKKSSHTKHHYPTTLPSNHRIWLIVLMALLILAVIILTIFTIRFNIKKIDVAKDSQPSLFNSIFQEFNKSFSTNNSLINN